MADLISRAAALEVINAVKGITWSQSGKVLCGKMYSQIKDLPAVDAVPVVHGRWITYPECLAYEGAYHDEHIVCSACHSVWNIIDNDTERFNYCPNCGAKMDGKANG